MAYLLHLPAAFFHSTFVPAQSVFSDQTTGLTAYCWRPFPATPDEELRIPCAPGEAEDWRVRSRGALLGAGLLTVIGLAALVFSQAQLVLTRDRIVGSLVGAGFLALGIYRGVKAETEAVRLEARPDLHAVTIVWPPKLFFIYNIYAAALAAWREKGMPTATATAAEFADDVQPGWDQAGGTGTK